MRTFRLAVIASIIATTFMACATLPYRETRYIIDYRPYLAEGVRISPTDNIGLPYDYLAEIMIEVAPGMKQSKVYTTSGDIITKQEYRGSDIQELVKNFVECAKDLGADGIVNFKINVSQNGQSVKLIGWAVKTI